MVITYYGLSCFKIQSGQFVLTTDPYSPASGLKSPRFQADLVLLSHNHPDHSHTKLLKSRDGKDIFTIEGPGEYEYQGIPIRALETFHDSQKGKKYGKNTMYLFEIEHIRLLHMGDFGQKDISPDMRNELGDIDILLIPVGGGATLSAKQAHGIINELEPNMVIPMHYKLKNLSIKLDPVATFLKEMEASDIKPQEKLAIRASDFKKAPEHTKAVSIVVLQAASE